MIAFSGVRSSWLILARNLDFARLAASAFAKRLVERNLLHFQLLDQPVVLGAVLKHRKRGALQALHQEDEIEVDAGRDDGHEPVEGLARHEEAQAKRRRHGDRARVQDGHDRGREQHPDRGDDHERGEQEEIGGLAWLRELGEGHRRPGDAVQELARGEVAAPLVQIGGVARLLLELPRERKQDAFGNENRRKP